MELTMKVLVFLAFVTFVSAVPNDDYSRYDNFDIDEVINNHRLLFTQVKCFLGIGKCTRQGSDIKKMIPDALQNSCSKCSEKQKILVATMTQAVMQKMPEEWKKLNQLHNPDGKYDKKIQEFVKQYAKKSN